MASVLKRTLYRKNSDLFLENLVHYKTAETIKKLISLSKSLLSVEYRLNWGKLERFPGTTTKPGKPLARVDLIQSTDKADQREREREFVTCGSLAVTRFRPRPGYSPVATPVSRAPLIALPFLGIWIHIRKMHPYLTRPGEPSRCKFLRVVLPRHVLAPPRVTVPPVPCGIKTR